jgi:hypothetical protein
MISIDVVADDSEPLPNEGIVSTYEEWESHLTEEERSAIDFEGIALLTDLIDHYSVGPVAVFNGRPIAMKTARYDRIDHVRDAFGGEEVIFYRLVKTGPLIDAGTLEEVYRFWVRYNIVEA